MKTKRYRTKKAISNSKYPRPRTAEAKREADIERLLFTSQPAFECFHIEEPLLVFGNHGVSPHPKEGLEEYGPILPPSDPLPIGVIGTSEGIEAFRRFLDRVQHPVSPGLNSKGKTFNPLCFPPFPGTGRAFRSRFETAPSIQSEIPLRYFEQAIDTAKTTDKLRNVVQLVVEKLGTLKDGEPEPKVVAVVFPQCVEDHCAAVGASMRLRRVLLTPADKLERSFDRDRKKGQFLLDLALAIEEPPSTNDRGYWNLHHALKAHAMSSGLPTQMVWQSTLSGAPQNQDPATLVWNLLTALYYKAGRVPWQLETVPANTCFVGVSFYKQTPFRDSPLHTSLAQVFSGHGEGLVLKGGRAHVDENQGDRKPHLLEDDAKKLLQRAVVIYMSHHKDMKPERVVVHKSSRFTPEELKGFKSALDGIPRFDFLTLERMGDQFMRLGYEPPLRGTVISLHSQRHVVFTGGYIPHLGTYPGHRIPNPVEIIEHHGDSTPETLSQEIMALTKLNWNSCAFASAEPITLQFARTIGRILTEIPDGSPIQDKYRFYM